MKPDNQARTYLTYEDPKVVQAFLDKNGEPRFGTEFVWEPLREFAERVGSGRVLDIGCGPGIHARQFARLGFDVTAIDYSLSMIEAAGNFGERSTITYVDLEMQRIAEAFEEASFDAAWASASMIHVLEVDVPGVLGGIHRVLKPGGLFHVSLKGGRQGARMVVDDKYGLITEREFVFWNEENFWRLLVDAGFTVENVRLETGGMTGTETTRWLKFLARA